MPGYTDEMTFLQRVVNVGSYVATRILMEIMSKTMNDLKAKYNIRPEISFQEATGKAELVLITADFALEYPQPLLPGKSLTKHNIINPNKRQSIPYVVNSSLRTISY